MVFSELKIGAEPNIVKINRMNNKAQKAVESQLGHLDSSDPNQTFEVAKMGPPDGVPSVFISFNSHICEK